MSSPGRTPSLVHRLNRPFSPLAVLARDSSPGARPPRDTRPNAAAMELVHALELEHRVNRKQAVELEHEREQIRRLRIDCESVPATDPDTDPTSPSRAETFARELAELHAENATLREQRDALEQQVETRRRENKELESQLIRSAAQLDGLRRKLRDQHGDWDNYLLQAAASSPLQMVRDAFDDMSVGELNEASLALGGAFTNARTTARAGTPQSMGDIRIGYENSRRPVTPFPTLRPQSSHGFPLRERTAMAGDSPPTVPAPLESPVDSIGSSGSGRKPKGVHFAMDDRKKGKGKFKVSSLFHKK